MSRQKISDTLYKEYIQRYKEEIRKLENNEDFIRNDAVRNKELKHIIMYKLCRNPLSESKEFLFESNSPEKKYKYEFLVEFDTETPGYGIYYGCRATMDFSIDSEKEIEKQIDLINEDWAEIKDEVKKILNNVFQNKKYCDRSFRITNNVNDNTYWSFCIALNDEEDVLQIASRAVKLIANCYLFKNTGKTLFEHKLPDYRKKEKKPASARTKYTIEAFERSLQQLKTENAASKFLKFISRSESLGYIARNRFYETAWDLQKSENQNKNIFIGAIRILLSELGVKNQWSLFERIILQELKQNQPDKALGEKKDVEKSMKLYKDIMEND